MPSGEGSRAPMPFPATGPALATSENEQVARQKLLASAAGKSRSEKTLDELHAEQQACEGGCAAEA